MICSTAGIAGTKNNKRFSSEESVSVSVLSDGNSLPQASLNVS